MSYKNQLLTILGIITISFLIVVYFLKNQDARFCNQVFECFTVLVYGASYQYFFLPTASLLLSVIPLFYLDEKVYKTWQRFAVVAIPVVAILIFLAPTSAPGDYITLGHDREVASMMFSVLFVLVSYILIIYKSFSLRSK